MTPTQRAILERLEQYDTQLSDLSDMSRAQRLATELMTLIQLYAGVVCAGNVPKTTESQIDRVFDSIASKLNIDYAREKDRYTSECASMLPEPSKAPSDIPLPPFSEMVRPYFLQQEAARNREGAATARTLIESLEIVPKSWKGTKKEWLEKQKDAIQQARNTRDESEKLATRYKNDTLTADEYPGEVQSLNTKIQRAEQEQKGVLTVEQREARLSFLLDKIFADEYAGGNYDFFPTPDDIIERYMVSDVKLPKNPKILEPSAGRGNIADVVRAKFPNASIDVVELSDLRREVLHHKGYTIVGTDFLEVGVATRNDRGVAILSPEWQDKYDAVFMNPPFLGGIGTQHVQRAAEMLKIGGTLVAVVPTGYVDGSSKNNVYFQEWMRDRGTFEFIIVREDEYNKNHDRKITIDLAIMTYTKERNLEAIDAAKAAEDVKEVATGIRKKWSGEKVDLPTDAGEIDTEFVPPKIIVARPDITAKASKDHISASYRKRYDFIKDHVYEGVNKAIEGLDRSGGFLLADGTGTGKTIQALLTARHYWQTTGQPVLIFTVDDRVIQGSFFADAIKLGWSAPDFIDTGVMKRPKRPDSYSGLYDELTPKDPTVYLYDPAQGIRDGINITTYNTLSHWKGLESLEQAVGKAKDEYNAQMKLYREAAKSNYDKADAMFPKDSRGRRPKKEKGEVGFKETLTALNAASYEELVTNHPSARELYLAVQAYKNSTVQAMRDFVAKSQLVIFDEAHKVKNAGDGLDDASMSGRARLALTIINNVPRILYMTATPADRPFDVLYLKKLGFWRDEQEYIRSMYTIGYRWEEEKTNKAGEVIADGRWVSPSNQTPEQIAYANYEMRRLFTMATEDGNMLRREIQLTNLSVKIHKFAAPESALNMMRSIDEAYTEEVNGRMVKDFVAIIGKQMQELERYKVDKAIELVDDAVRRGRQVIVFCYTTEEGEEENEKTGTVKAGITQEVKNILAARYGEDKVGVLIGTSGKYEEFRRLENVQNFQKGIVRVIVGTITSGGTGVNLDDTTGRNPREMVVITPPLSFINVMQGVGRIVRANTKSRSVAHFVFTDNTAIDQWLSSLLATKFSTLNATVEGESSRLSLAEAESVEDTGSQGVISLVATEAIKKDDGRPTKHPLRTKKNNTWTGWELPNRRPYAVKLDGTPKNTTIAIFGKTRDDLTAFAKEYAELITKLGLKPNVNRAMQKYGGSHYGRRFDERDETALQVLDELLNVIDPRLATTISTVQQHNVGDTVELTETLMWAGLPAGTLAEVIAVRPKLSESESWRYDIEVNGQKYKNVEAYKLRSTLQQTEVVAYPVGTRFDYKARRNYYQSVRYSRAVVILSKTPTSVTVESRTWNAEAYGRTYDNAEPVQIDIDVMDFADMVRRGFEEYNEDEKGREWRRNWFDEPTITLPNGEEPPYQMVADGMAEQDVADDRACVLRGQLYEIEQMLTTWYKANVKTMDADTLRAAHAASNMLNKLKLQLGGVGGTASCATCPPLNADGSRCITDQCLKILETACEVGTQTWSTEAGTMVTERPLAYTGVDPKHENWYDGKTGYPRTKARYELHKRIIQEIRDTTVCAARLTDKPIAILTGGAPGSGKSSFIRKHAPWLLDKTKFMHVDADAIREKLPEYAGWNASLTHEEAGVLVKIALQEIAVPCDRNVLYDGTMNNLRKYDALIDRLKGMGYEVYAIFMGIPIEVSKQRVAKRYAKTGRYVPSYVIEGFYDSVARDNAFGTLKNKMDGWIMVDGVTAEIKAQGGKAIPTIDSDGRKVVERKKTSSSDSLDVPADVSAEAEQGLEWRREFGRGGTEVGVARARDLKNGKVSYDTVKRMVSYFARHEVDKQAKGFRSGEKGYPSAGRIAWALWGGDAGKAWAENIVASRDVAKKKSPVEAEEIATEGYKRLPLSAIKTDEARFQPRKGLSEQKVMAIVDNYDPQKFTPITVWSDPSDGETYVLAGHHRLEAAKRLPLPTVPVRYFKGNEREAIDYALTSNVLHRGQTAIENAEYVRGQRADGTTETEIRRKADEFYGKEAPLVVMLSYLPADAAVIQDMEQFAAGSDEYKELETMARWVGSIVRKYPSLTIQQVNELYRYLRQNFRISGRKYRSSVEFSEAIERLFAARFPLGQMDEAPLNLGNVRPRTDAERALDQREVELQTEIAAEKKQVEELRKRLAKAESMKAEGQAYINTQGTLDAMQESERRIASLQGALVQLRAMRSEVVASAVEAQGALFGLGAITEAELCSIDGIKAIRDLDRLRKPEKPRYRLVKLDIFMEGLRKLAMERGGFVNKEMQHAIGDQTITIQAGKRIYMPITLKPDPIQGNSRTEAIVRDILEERGYELVDYVEGTARKHGDKRLMKVNKVLVALGYQEYVDEVNKDEARAKAKQRKNEMLVFTAEPIDIVEMTQGRGWQEYSCMSVDRLGNEYLAADIKYCSVMCYLIDAKDTAILRPKARISIKQYHRSVDEPAEPSYHYAVASAQYGTAPRSFTQTVENLVEEAQIAMAEVEQSKMGIVEASQKGKFSLMNGVYHDGYSSIEVPSMAVRKYLINPLPYQNISDELAAEILDPCFVDLITHYEVSVKTDGVHLLAKKGTADAFNELYLRVDVKRLPLPIAKMQGNLIINEYCKLETWENMPEIIEGALEYYGAWIDEFDGRIKSVRELKLESSTIKSLKNSPTIDNRQPEYRTAADVFKRYVDEYGNDSNDNRKPAKPRYSALNVRYCYALQSLAGLKLADPNMPITLIDLSKSEIESYEGLPKYVGMLFTGWLRACRDYSNTPQMVFQYQVPTYEELNVLPAYTHMLIVPKDSGVVKIRIDKQTGYGRPHEGQLFVGPVVNNAKNASVHIGIDDTSVAIAGDVKKIDLANHEQKIVRPSENWPNSDLYNFAQLDEKQKIQLAYNALKDKPWP